MVEKGRLLNMSNSISIFNYVLLLVIISMFWIYKRHGFDLTDEAFYAISSTQPENITSHLSSFGYLTNYMIKIVNCDFHTTRIFGLILILGSWSILCVRILKKSKDFISSKEILLIYPSLVIPVWIFYWDGIYSLSYNLYAVSGLNLILYGLAGKDYASTKTSELFIAALGVFICLMSKFSVIPLLIIIVTFFAICSKSKRELIFISKSIGLSTLFFLLHFTLSGDSIFGFFDRHKHCFENLHLLKSEHFSFFNELSIFDIFIQIISFASPAYSCLCLVILINFAIVHKYRHLNTLNIPIALILSLSLLVVYKSHSPDRWILNYQLLFYSIYATSFITLYNSKVENSKVNLQLKYILVAPLLISFGSGDSITYLGSKCTFYLIFAIGIFLLSQKPGLNVVISIFFIFSTVFTSALLFFGFKHPYRIYGRVNQQTTEISTFDGDHHFIVNDDLGTFLTKLKITAKNNGWRENTPLLNTTNKPGITFVLSGKVLTVPWLLGSYEGSDDWAVAMIKRYQENNKLNEAWVITNADPNNKLTGDIFKRIDLDIVKNYKKIEVPGTNGYYTNFKMWKPINH